MKKFTPHPVLESAGSASPDTIAVAISGKHVLVQNIDGKISLPMIKDLPADSSDRNNGIILGSLNNMPCAGFTFNGNESGNLQLIELRRAFTLVPEETCTALCRAKSLIEWKKRRNYCGACAAELIPSEKDIAMKCPACGEPYYPQLSPAVIVAVTREDKILLAHNCRFAGRIHSLIAGFVEAGESVEQAVAREIREETALEVKDLRYVSSQSWPFPNSLMLGFTAKYSSGELSPDGSELECAGWFSKNNLPQLPERGSIARMIIDDFCNEKRFFC